MKVKKALILSAGLGTRLLPLTKYKGKNPLEIILDEAQRDPSGKFGIFVANISRIPQWADFASIARGQEFLVSKFLLINYILGLGTLVGGFSCPQINEILVRLRFAFN